MGGGLIGVFPPPFAAYTVVENAVYRGLHAAVARILPQPATRQKIAYSSSGLVSRSGLAGQTDGGLPAVQTANAVDDGQEGDRAAGEEAGSQADDKGIVVLVDAVNDTNDL